MKWFKRMLWKWSYEGREIVESGAKVRANGLAIATDGETLSSEPLRLSIYRANGGTVVETRTYDRQKDRSQNQLHIISHDDDLGHSLAKIIMMESFRAS
jgi:hypothetical protein